MIAPSSRRRKPTRAPLLLLLLLLLAALGGLYALGRPTLAFTNRLAGPVRLMVDNDAPRTLAPGESVRMTLPWGKTIVAVWELVRPHSADGRPMGEEVRESVVVGRRWATISRSAAARSSAGDYFAPLITNATDDLLRVRVNAGLEGALDCGCAVRPGARRTFIGYYHLYRNSTVQVRASGGRSALFPDLGPSIVAPDGTVGLRFESKDLRAR